MCLFGTFRQCKIYRVFVQKKSPRYTCALFSGQLLAKQQDHAFVWFATGGHQLRHEADSDELRAAAEESAEGLREHHNWQKSRKPESYFR